MVEQPPQRAPPSTRTVRASDPRGCHASARGRRPRRRRGCTAPVRCGHRRAPPAPAWSRAKFTQAMDVCHVDAAGDERRAPVDHAAVDLARLLVGGSRHRGRIRSPRTRVRRSCTASSSTLLIARSSLVQRPWAGEKTPGSVSESLARQGESARPPGRGCPTLHSAVDDLSQGPGALRVRRARLVAARRASDGAPCSGRPPASGRRPPCLVLRRPPR